AMRTDTHVQVAGRADGDALCAMVQTVRKAAYDGIGDTREASHIVGDRIPHHGVIRRMIKVPADEKNVVAATDIPVLSDLRPPVSIRVTENGHPTLSIGEVAASHEDIPVFGDHEVPGSIDSGREVDCAESAG